jgi:RHS repeat-associated protein
MVPRGVLLCRAVVSDPRMAWGAEMWLPGSSYVEPSTTEVEIIHGIASSPRKWALPLLPPPAKEVSMAQQTVKSRAPANQEGMKSRGHWNREAFVRHRDYSPTLGRFIERDPIGFEAGDNNWYRFVANGPTGKVDPSGLYVDLAIEVISIGTGAWSFCTNVWAGHLGASAVDAGG